MIIPEFPIVYVYITPVNLRLGIDKLAGIVANELRKGPRDGALFVFFNKDRNRLKILFHDRTGYLLLYKRMDRGSFPIPTTLTPNTTEVSISPEQLQLMLQGVQRAPRPKKQTLH